MQYMDFSLLLYIGMLALGILVGSRRSVRSRTLPWLGRLQFVALIVLIAILGVEIGADDKVISSLGEIGLSALVITVFALAGSLLAVTLVRRLLGLDRQGRTVSQREDPSGKYPVQPVGVAQRPAEGRAGHPADRRSGYRQMPPAVWGADVPGSPMAGVGVG